MNDDDYSLDRNLSDLFEEAMDFGLADDIKGQQGDRYNKGSVFAKGGMKSIECVIDTLTGREVA